MCVANVAFSSKFRNFQENHERKELTADGDGKKADNAGEAKKAAPSGPSAPTGAKIITAEDKETGNIGKYRSSSLLPSLLSSTPFSPLLTSPSHCTPTHYNTFFCNRLASV